ncbi:MAG: hypothetical protein RLZZ127_1057, partial [Planctomycetota bacterium]
NPLTPEACARLIDTGLESGRLDLYWQGVSHLLGGRPDPRRWRDHALVVGDSRYAVAYTEPISATEAAAFAAACGGELATPDDPAVAEIIDRSVNQVETFWTGARWTGYQLQDATGRQLRLPADFGWFPSRRAGSLPAVDLPVSVCRPRRWCLRDEHMAEGVIIRFRSR